MRELQALNSIITNSNNTTLPATFLFIFKYILLFLKIRFKTANHFSLKQRSPLNVLVAPLDWGLGHTTRCIPLIHQLKQAQCHVYVACNAVARILLEQEIPGLEFLPLRGYEISYTSKRWMAIKILQQIPKIIAAIRNEHRWLKRTLAACHIDIVFSDNRYGLYSSHIPCIFITHQLRIKAPWRRLEKWIQIINYRFINRFSECWVPDYAGALNIAGALSHPVQLPALPVKYIGPLARLTRISNAAVHYKWLVLLSGPEPQRTMLEKLLLKVMGAQQEPAFIVRGLPGAAPEIGAPPHCTVVNHLPAARLQEAFAQSEYIICRSGYTTVMEILAMQKKAILIPTPGQTEQEYLGSHLMQQHWCYSFQQEEDIAGHLRQAQLFRYHLPQLPATSLQAIVQELVERYP